jgi:hypothetical protein
MTQKGDRRATGRESPAMRGRIYSLSKPTDNREARACEMVRELESGASPALGWIAAANDGQRWEMQQVRISVHI